MYRRRASTRDPRAQRLSASQRSAPEARGSAGGASIMCSTPFGITEVGTRTTPAITLTLGECSTPFGITEVGTVDAWANAMRPRCAQRLSASQRSARRSRRAARSRDRSAQRLSASQRSARRSRDVRLAATAGAQRLSASQRSAQRIPLTRIASPTSVLNAFRHHRGRHAAACMRTVSTAHRVLNAFRHHRGRHSADRHADRGMPLSVLNAFRHHRGRHIQADAQRSSSRIGAQRLSASQRSARRGAGGSSSSGDVLNAFRHHRGRHSCRQDAVKARDSMCSTPFGITEVGTQFRDAPTNGPDERAQRLSASQRSARRHGSISSSVRICAQRLSASQRSAPGRAARRPAVRRRVLNAFRHHRGRHAVEPRP